VTYEVGTSREAYRQLCEQEESIPLFSQAWWLDGVADEEWEVVLAYGGAQIVGALPYVRRRKLGCTLIAQPKLTQSLGPWVRPSKKSYPKALAYEKDVLGALVHGLPTFDRYTQNWNHTQQNWLPFYWNKFSQTTLYTYILSDLGNQSTIWNGMQANIRGDIRKARDRFGVTIRPATNLNEFLDLNRQTFARQGREPPYSEELVARIDAAGRARQARDAWVAVDPGGALHAGAYIVRHGNTAYYLMGGGDPHLRRSGATSLCLWEAIQRQPEHIENFDFEGSMLEPVERFFRAFGARQIPYFRVTRTNSRLLKVIGCVRDAMKRAG